MSMIRPFEKPLGMRDTLPGIFEKKEWIRQVGREFFSLRGFDFIKTPTLEYYETVGRFSAILESNLFKLVDSQGNTLVLRPDMTTPIARIASTKLLKEKVPQRLAYFSNVFRAQELEGGKPAEFEQMGIEVIGDDSIYADTEVILTTIDLMKRLGIESFKITIGHAGILEAIIRKNVQTEEQFTELHQLLVNRNYVGFEEAVDCFVLTTEQASTLKSFIEEATSLTNMRQISKYLYEKEALIYMEQLASILEIAGVQEYVAFDFTIASHMNYYTGMMFEVFAANTGYPLGNGGRYNGLLENFGADMSAVGFALRIDYLLEAMPKIEDEKESVLILFVSTQLAQALEQTQQLREQGYRTTMQSLEGIENFAQYEKQFTKVVRVGQGGTSYE